jgi:hypothetical protein
MNVIRSSSLLLVTAALLAVSAPPVAASAANNSHVLLSQEEVLAKVGAPTNNFETVEVGGYTCYQTTHGRLLSNGRSIDVIGFNSESERQCSEEVRVVAGEVRMLTIDNEGEVVETDGRAIELPGRCVFKIGELRTKVTFPALLLGATLEGTAKLQKVRSAATCASTIAARSFIDPSDVEFASIPYEAELRRA